MAQTVIMERQTLVFQYEEEGGVYVSAITPALFVPETGADYQVLWGEETWLCSVFTKMDDEETVYLGNPSLEGGEDNGIPFLMIFAKDGSCMIIGTTESGETREVGVWMLEEDAQVPSATVKIKGYSGAEHTYESVPKVWLAAPESTAENPVLVPFTYGEALDNVEVVPDFSQGDMPVIMEPGYLARSMVVRKPKNWIVEPDKYVEFELNDNGEIIKATPHNLNEVSAGLFAYLTYLEEIDFSHSPDITCIREHAFRGCAALKSIAIPDGVTSVGDYAFYDCKALNDIEIPDSVTIIGNYAFSGCSGLTEFPEINSVESIGNYAFTGCGNLQNLTLPSCIKTIGHHAFQNCKTITNVAIPEGVTELADNLFYNCTLLTSVAIPNSVVSIGAYAFNTCAITAISLPSNLESIGDYCFYGCNKLTNITIPASVSVIGKNAFYGAGLTTAVFKDSSGWYVTKTKDATSGTSVAVTSSSTAATYLKNTYGQGYYWYDNT